MRYSVGMADAKRIVSDALDLSEEKRTEVALRLLDSLESPDPHAHLDDEELVSELNRRAQSVVDGAANLVPAADALDRLRAILPE